MADYGLCSDYSRMAHAMLLADPAGSGKTRHMMQILAEAKRTGTLFSVFVVTASTIIQCQRELIACYGNVGHFATLGVTDIDMISGTIGSSTG